MLACIGNDVNLGGAMLNRWSSGVDLVDLTTLAMMFDLPAAFDIWRLDKDAEQMAMTV